MLEKEGVREREEVREETAGVEVREILSECVYTVYNTFVECLAFSHTHTLSVYPFNIHTHTIIFLSLCHVVSFPGNYDFRSHIVHIANEINEKKERACKLSQPHAHTDTHTHTHSTHTHSRIQAHHITHTNPQGRTNTCTLSSIHG